MPVRVADGRRLSAALQGHHAWGYKRHAFRLKPLDKRIEIVNPVYLAR